MLEVTIAACSVILIAVSQLLFKSAASGPRRRAAYRYLLDPKIILGLGLNGIAAACWVFALRRLEISYLYPILSVNYLLVLSARATASANLCARGGSWRSASSASESSSACWAGGCSRASLPSSPSHGRARAR